MQFHNLLGNGQSKPCSSGPAGAGAIYAVELLKYGLKHCPGNLISLVCKDNFHILPLHLCLDLNPGIIIAVCDRVPQNIVKDPGQLIRIPVDHQILFHIYLAGKLLFLQHAIEFVRQLLQHQ